MNDLYTIIIPVFNEILKINTLLENLKSYSQQGHEVLIINDGSTDGSKNILSECKFINLLNLRQNQGKGIALIKGLQIAKYDKIIIFDGDLELDPNEIKKLMILNRYKNINFVIANRLIIHQSNSIWDIGNKILTSLFNFLHNSNVKDALCCAKSFFKSDIRINTLQAKKFDIDIEITSQLVKIYSKIKNVNLKYQRRTIAQGKKLRLKDSFAILIKIIQSKI